MRALSVDRFVRLVFGVICLFAAVSLQASSEEDRIAESAAEGAADARVDFDHGVMMLLGEQGMTAGSHTIGEGLSIEIVPHACAPHLDPAAYMDAYNDVMKSRIRERHGVDIDALPATALSKPLE